MAICRNEVRMREGKRGHIAIAKQMANRLYPLALAIALLIGIGFPAVYAILAAEVQMNTATCHAGELAERLGKMAREDVTLWKFQNQKYAAVLDDFLPQKNIMHVRILDESGKALTMFERVEAHGMPIFRPLALSSEAPIVFNRQTIGTVVIETASDRLIFSTLAVFLFFAVVGFGLAVSVYHYPTRVAKGLEGEIGGLIAELESFSYTVSHDLHAPLRHISGYSGVLLEDHGDRLGPDVREMLSRIHGSSERMKEIIDSLLELSRIGRTELKRERVNLGTIARDIADGLKSSGGERQTTFRIQDNVMVEGDPHLLRNVLENLLGNAWKFTAKRNVAVIEFGTVEVDGSKTCFVRDNGAGFDMAYADKLFAPFQRLHSAAEYDGSGIGLATVRRIINHHGGNLWAEGKPGEGAAFYFSL
ncbi:histidine kinase [Geobacter hydrogenophilus]|nr:histidine kinase [Geobacter hydrogenophilus]